MVLSVFERRKSAQQDVQNHPQAPNVHGCTVPPPQLDLWGSIVVASNPGVGPGAEAGAEYPGAGSRGSGGGVRLGEDGLEHWGRGKDGLVGGFCVGSWRGRGAEDAGGQRRVLSSGRRQRRPRRVEGGVGGFVGGGRGSLIVESGGGGQGILGGGVGAGGDLRLECSVCKRGSGQILKAAAVAVAVAVTQILSVVGLKGGRCRRAEGSNPSRPASGYPEDSGEPEVAQFT